MMPPLKTGTVGLAKDGSVWDLASSQQIGSPGKNTITMGSAVSINSGDILPKGDWVIDPNLGNCTLVTSDGTATSPDNGEAYLLTVS